MRSVPPMSAEPRHHTPRNLARATLGGVAASVAKANGRPFMPWQRRAADVALELDPTTGLLWYDLVIVRVQRQAGKTELIGAVNTTRALSKRNARLWYTAQKGKDASEWMREEYISRLADAAGLFGKPKTVGCRYLVSLRAGQEAVKWKATGAKFQAIPPTKDAMHGKQSDITTVDEAWFFTAEAGAELRQAIRPTMNTRPGSQLWVVSAGEALDSAYFADYIEIGTLSLADPNSRVCFIDYGIPEGGDPEDLDLVAACHPAVGYTIDRAALEAARVDFSKDPAGWARAYATITTGAREFAFPPAMLAGRTTVTASARLVSDDEARPVLDTAPILIRQGGELLAIDAAGLILVSGSGRRLVLDSAAQSVAAPLEDGSYRLEDAERTVVALSA